MKVIDFGHVVAVDASTGQYIDTRRGLVGTPGLYAPESLERYEYSSASDVWQLACIVYW